jgi:hypothetical protein
LISFDGDETAGPLFRLIGEKTSRISFSFVSRPRLDDRHPLAYATELRCALIEARVEGGHVLAERRHPPVESLMRIMQVLVATSALAPFDRQFARHLVDPTPRPGIVTFDDRDGKRGRTSLAKLQLRQPAVEGIEAGQNRRQRVATVAGILDRQRLQSVQTLTQFDQMIEQLR